jgi:hypothetical protein
MNLRTLVASPASVLLVAIVAVLATSAAHTSTLQRETQALPDVAAPPAGQAYWIARSMRLNGVPMTLKSFAAPVNAAEVLNHYERELRTSSDQKTRRSHEAQWRVLSVMAPKYFISVRARDTARGAEGTIAVSPPLSEARASTHTRFPHPDSARVVSLQQYDDEGIEAEHISLMSRRSVTIEAREFARLLAREGWQLQRNEGAADRRGGYIIEAQKAASLAVINLHRTERGGATSIMVVWRKA